MKQNNKLKSIHVYEMHNGINILVIVRKAPYITLN